MRFTKKHMRYILTHQSNEKIEKKNHHLSPDPSDDEGVHVAERGDGYLLLYLGEMDGINYCRVEGCASTVSTLAYNPTQTKHTNTSPPIDPL